MRFCVSAQGKQRPVRDDSDLTSLSAHHTDSLDGSSHTLCITSHTEALLPASSGLRLHNQVYEQSRLIPRYVVRCPEEIECFHQKSLLRGYIAPQSVDAHFALFHVKKVYSLR